ncbi:MAG: META domain-containing protein [Halieaceae bacterium]
MIKLTALASTSFLLLFWASALFSSGSLAEDNALSAHALANATYSGLKTDDIEITLTDGEWQGEPYQEGGAVVPRVQLLGNLVARADLTGNGVEDAVVLVNFAPGGTGQLLHLALMTASDGKPEQTAAAFIGDRVRVRDLRVEGDTVALDLVQAGPRDPSCCPGEMATRLWQYRDGDLAEIDSTADTARVSIEAIEGQQWQLSHWRYQEPVEESTTITLAYEEGKLVGNAGCNNYFASVSNGNMPGDIKVSAPGATRMACRNPDHGAAEQRFLSLLPTVWQFSWMAGQLVLSYGEGSDTGVLFFKPI